MAAVCYNIIIVTLSSYEYARKVLDSLGILKFVKEIVSVGSEGQYSKKYYYLKILQQYSLSRVEICVIGDNFENDIRPAKALGIPTIYVSRNAESSDGRDGTNIYEALNYLMTKK